MTSTSVGFKWWFVWFVSTLLSIFEPGKICLFNQNYKYVYSTDRYSLVCPHLVLHVASMLGLWLTKTLAAVLLVWSRLEMKESILTQETKKHRVKFNHSWQETWTSYPSLDISGDILSLSRHISWDGTMTEFWGTMLGYSLRMMELSNNGWSQKDIWKIIDATSPGQQFRLVEHKILMQWS